VSGYSDKELTALSKAPIRPNAAYPVATAVAADLARELLAARRALRKIQILVADAVRLGAIDQMYEDRFGDVLARALGTRAPRKDARRKKQ
jgi:hypothetical protein